MHKFHGLILAMLLGSGPPAVLAQPTADADESAQSEALIDPLVAADQFSGSVLVARNGVPIFRRAFGLADREWTVANTPDAKFRIGSITKQFTATAILQLSEAGKLSIDDPVSKYYAEAPATWSAITIRHLLTHTSGIPSYTGIAHFFDQQARLDRTPEEIIKLTRDAPLEFAPGSKYAYDNTGYVILGYIIEKVSGETYPDYVRHHILDPVGMKSSGYDSSESIISRRADGYSRDKAQVINARFIAMSEPFSAGSLYSTVDDMLLWDQALYAAKILRPASLEAMFTDYGHGYGFGWVINPQYGRPRVLHAGGINGFITRFDRYTQDKLTVVVFSNEDYAAASVARIADGLAAIYLGVAPRTADGEALLRRTVEALRSGAPNYDQMGSQVAEAVRARPDALKGTLEALGDLRSVSLMRADRHGIDHYKILFRHGDTKWEIKEGDDGKLVVAAFDRLR